VYHQLYRRHHPSPPKHTHIHIYTHARAAHD
jgi:hypothetical protein